MEANERLDHAPGNLRNSASEPTRTLCFFVSDLHGSTSRYEKLFSAIEGQGPSALFLGGDLFPLALEEDFLDSYLLQRVSKLKEVMGPSYPAVFLILGNDDPRCFEPRVQLAEERGLWNYIHGRKLCLHGTPVYGYACVPPTPFRLKDWERYDVSRYCDPGCVSPEEGVRTTPVVDSDVKWGTIKDDLSRLTGNEPLDDAVFLLHSPPYDTPLDRAALDGKRFEHVPLDVHVGSIAIRRFIEARQPLLTLHGHIHESPRLTGEWKTNIGRTVCVSAAHDGPELALVRFDLSAPAEAIRELF